MIQLECRLKERFPHWFRGRRARLARPLVRTLGRLSRLDALDAFLACHPGLKGLWLVTAALEFLGARYTVTNDGLSRVPRQGALLVVANHPCGARDALALLDALGRVRRDVRIVANELLADIEGLRELLLPVRVLGGRAQREHLRAIDAALADGHCVIVFPAGEVARLGLHGVREGDWNDGFARFARRRNVPVLPVRVEARNSSFFYGASLLFRPAGTALLAREMFAQRGRELQLHVGHATHLPDDVDTRELARRVRDGLMQPGHAAAVDVVDSHASTARASAPVARAVEPLAPPADPRGVRDDVHALALLGETLDGRQIRAGRLMPGSPLLHELGRLREQAFRAVGEGTGRALDIDEYDGWYDQILLWDEGSSRIVGGYRVARGAQVLRERGLSGLYSASLFSYPVSAIPRLAQALELGRSFVVPDYWGGRSVDYLWQGIGAYVQRCAGVRFLVGPVSISAALPREARDRIVAFYSQWHGASVGVHARRPYRAPMHRFDAADADAAFEQLRTQLDTLGCCVPMLYRQYVDLCEPGGARFLAFGEDAAFSDVVDGLVEVDLSRLRARKRERYLTPRAKAAVRQYTTALACTNE